MEQFGYASLQVRIPSERYGKYPRTGLGLDIDDAGEDSFNHFAQDADFNRGDYRVLESQWAKDVKQGSVVRVKIVPGYVASSQRPSTIAVMFSVNGHTSFRQFTNGGSTGKSHGG